MQTLIIKSIHEHGFGFAFTKDEHDQVFLPKKLLADFEHLDWLEPADEVYAKIIPNYKDKLDKGDPVSVAEVLRDLYRGEGDPEQSYSERQLYELALGRFAREMVAVNDILIEEAIKKTEENLKVK